MTVTAADWDARVTRLSKKMPDSLRKAVDWLREPSRLWIRLIAAVLLILGGIFSILPVLGLWMLPLGLALLAQDVPALKVPMEKAARWIEAKWAQFQAWRKS
ncbi:hypothetical protein [Methylobacterium soli]|jgi:hypothetical protein|uniref:Uncharacterized protein n=1 Tax=Methylobacterium soli TaxID=553447 RepID=A0A6L3SWU8_9HYPH|nr:hypothetical protein [Methylobacterium soli]KAB1078202.1 hypothetical protein F6X53_15700 [Methylobacterium soli]GJE42621.1 hypothetical protein AEGHOMDF_1793 [Methylobacterium soli]